MSHNVLFTGAGFTKNFGGFLGKEMHSNIFNHPLIQNQERIRRIMINDFDYESIYYRIIEGKYSDDEKRAIKTAIFEVYEKLDGIVYNWKFNNDSPYPVNIYGINRFIEHTVNRFIYFFTINQDLFIERQFHSPTHMGRLETPGVKTVPNRSSQMALDGPLKYQDFSTLPNKDEVKKTQLSLKGKPIFYIKLHGSYGWKSSDESNKLVIGLNKEKQIDDEPILKLYFSIFESILYQKDVRLFIIGYGFLDEHINKIIKKSMEQYNLELFILSPSEPRRLMDKLKNVFGEGLVVSNLRNYYEGDLLKVFPRDQTESTIWSDIKKQYFEKSQSA